MKAADKIRVLVADDHAILRSGLGLLINAQADMEVIGEATNGTQAVRKASVARPDVVLLDLSMPRTDSADTIRALCRLPRAPRVVVLTMHDDPAYLDTSLAAGASGYVVKKAADSELLAAIRAVHAGRQFVDATMGGGRLAQSRLRAAGGPRRRELLSEREGEVLRLLGAGHTNRAIAERLKLSVKTVETYRSRLCDKLGLHDRAGLVRYALQTGLVSADRLPFNDRP
jgi:two-component system response regulator NreC